MCSADKSRLVVRFLNVADGDSILVEAHENGTTFRLLIDAGRDVVGFPAPCSVCAAHLKRLGVEHLDLVVITHLHEDHFCGLDEMIGQVQIDTLLSPYLPRRTEPIPTDANAIKTVQGVTACINRWTEQMLRLKALGCRLEALEQTRSGVALTQQLSADFILPDAEALRFQKRVWEAMRGKNDLSEEDKFAAAKLRNPNSMRVRLHYGGREIELSGDCYGSCWENDAEKCDIFKLPHHGDAKALTPQLVRRLQPEYAVISCCRNHIDLKDRPSAAAAQMLRDCGARLWYTDAYDDGVQPMRSAPELTLVIHPDGKIQIENP